MPETIQNVPTKDTTSKDLKTLAAVSNDIEDLIDILSDTVSKGFVETRNDISHLAMGSSATSARVTRIDGNVKNLDKRLADIEISVGVLGRDMERIKASLALQHEMLTKIVEATIDE